MNIRESNMNYLKRHLWIEAEEWLEYSWDRKDCNTDVIVVFRDRSKWNSLTKMSRR